jgi:hypothetical protein
MPSSNSNKNTKNPLTSTVNNKEVVKEQPKNNSFSNIPEISALASNASNFNSTDPQAILSNIESLNDIYCNFKLPDINQGDLNNFAADFFDDSKIYKMEIGFLMHNINIWYTLFENYGKYLCGDLVNKRMDKCLIFSMKSDEYRGNITLDEVRKIIYLSGKLKDYTTPSEYTEEKRDDMGRKIVYSRYKVLDLVRQKF